MPVTTTSPLMAMALNSNMRIHERIETIKNSDGIDVISNEDEARAILAIPNAELKWIDSKESLMVAKLYANNYLKTGGKNLRDDLADLYHYFKNKGEKVITRVSNWMSFQLPIVAKN